MGIQNLVQSGGFDPSKYVPKYIGSNSFTPNTAYQTVVNIMGKGFISRATLNTLSAGSPTVNLRLTIDGVAYLFTGTLSNAFRAFGMIISRDIFMSGAAVEIRCDGGLYPGYTFATNSVPKTLPAGGGTINGGGVDCIVILPDKLFFNSSFIMEIMVPSGAYTFGYEFNGGILV